MQSVQTVVMDASVQPFNKLRVVILYALRYQKTQTANIASLIKLMLENGVSREDAQVLRTSPHFSDHILIELPVGVRLPQRRWCRSAARRSVFYRVNICQRSIGLEGSQGQSKKAPVLLRVAESLI